MIARADRVRDWHRPKVVPGGGVIGFDRQATVLVEGECWDTTLTEANNTLHGLGLPSVGNPNLECMCFISVSSSSVSDFLPDREFLSLVRRHAVLLSNPLCSYEEAVLGESDGSASPSAV